MSLQTAVPREQRSRYSMSHPPTLAGVVGRKTGIRAPVARPVDGQFASIDQFYASDGQCCLHFSHRLNAFLDVLLLSEQLSPAQRSN